MVTEPASAQTRSPPPSNLTEKNRFNWVWVRVQGNPDFFSTGGGAGDASTYPTPTHVSPLIEIYLIIFNNLIFINLQIRTKLF